MDTFGLPYYWIALGIVVAAKRISQQAITPQNVETIEELISSTEILESDQPA